MAHGGGCATGIFLWRTVLGAPRNLGISVAHRLRAPQKYNLVARILWHMGISCGCAIELFFGAPQIGFLLVVLWSPSCCSDLDQALRLGVTTGMNFSWTTSMLIAADIRMKVEDPTA